MNLLQFEQRLRHLSERDMAKLEKRIMQRIGVTFLKAVRDQLRKMGLIESKVTIQSFTRGKKGNVWHFDYDRDAITLEVGSWYFVARLLDEGYTISEPHFVPGHFDNEGRFIYNKSGKTDKSGQGIWMKPRTFIGRHYIDVTIEGFQGGMKALIDELLQKELKKVFG